MVAIFRSYSLETNSEVSDVFRQNKDCEYDAGEVNLINWENILQHNKEESIGTSMLKVSTFKSLRYNIMAKILIFVLTL